MRTGRPLRRTRYQAETAERLPKRCPFSWMKPSSRDAQGSRILWVHLPERYGNWRGVYSQLRMWAVDGTWERVFTALAAQADADEELNRVVSLDSTIVRAHQHAAGARKRRACGRVG